MSELINPLFEEEKEFLEHKKLEYERALRGDVEHIKEQTIQVGKLALVGAGVAGGIWLLRKAFGRRKRGSAPREERYEDGYSGFGDDYAEKLGSDHKWRGHWDIDEEPHPYADRADDDYSARQEEESDLDDNGLGEFPDFAPHSGPRHGRDHAADYYEAPADTAPADVYHTDGPAAGADDEGEDTPTDERRFWSEEHSHPTANRAYDDSRRLPKSDSFADLTPAEDLKQASPQAKKSLLGPAITSFMQSETGRVIMGQAAAVAMALVTKVIKDLLPSDTSETAKSSDLATPTVAAGNHTYDRPAVQAVPQSPVLDAQDPDADASIASRQPLA